MALKGEIKEMVLTKQTTANELQKFFDYCFEANSLLDNAVYALQYELRMPDFANFVHIHMAHFYPTLGDRVQEFALQRRVRIVRNAISAHTTIYSSPITLWQDIFDYFVEMEQILDRAIEVAIEDGSKPTEDFLREISANVLPLYIFQANQFLEGLKAYDEDNIVASFNHDYVSYIVLPIDNNDEDDD